ncbi:putative glucokinase [Calocera cornea HHB12733]|uniref:Phosphotransferase n=1 Tax=Calocera cornea HHB12733 TaxID=1353952 RepID=A0A165JWJ7_9BASI|nr:putative glucokinase [Calocera cornea HHB12733]
MSYLADTSLNPAALEFLERIERQFHLDDEQLQTILAQFLKEFELGLSKYGESPAMVPTFVTHLPDGTERGTFLALDLGGTNLRVCQVTLLGNRQVEMNQSKYRVSEALKTGEAEDLFNYIADSVDHFLTTADIPLTEDEQLYLGLTFSFPVEQTAINKGKLLTWTKGFAATHAIGNDVMQMLQDALDRRHVHVKCAALINDTVGCLMSRAYFSGGCILGAIFGTGTNGAYVEDMKAVKKLSTDAIDGPLPDKMVINTEWGAFDNARKVIPRTIFDNKLDRESINPRFQAYEKCISGMYLGEIVRNILLYLIDNSILFGGNSSKQFNTHYGFDTELMSNIENDQSDEGVTCRAILTQKMGMDDKLVSPNDIAIVRWGCKIVATRAAKLSGCAVAAIINQTHCAEGHEDFVDVGVDGSLIQFYPGFEDGLRSSLRLLVGENVEKRTRIGLAKDGSGIGAALGALASLHQERERQVQPVLQAGLDTAKASREAAEGVGKAALADSIA